jgi:hypothetical protein
MMDSEFLAVYLATDGPRIVFPVVKDDHGSYRLTEGTDGRDEQEKSITEN